MSERKPISKRTRFEVFKRDGFACSYCARKPPSVLLVVDHIIPVSGGGTNAMDNLATACDECNAGKSNVPLDRPPTPDRRAAAKKMREIEEQMVAYSDALNAVRTRVVKTAEAACDYWMEVYDTYKTPMDMRSTCMTFAKSLPLQEILEAIDIAHGKWAGNRSMTEASSFKYFCGVCWTKIREGELVG